MVEYSYSPVPEFQVPRARTHKDERVRILKNRNKALLGLLYKYLFLLIGAVLAAAGLELFLIPNNIIDGGIVGVSIIASLLSKVPLGIFTLVLNVPFLVLGYKQIGKSFVLSSLFAILVFSLALSLLSHPEYGLTKDVFLAAAFGGILLGIGVGIILRNGGSLDGTEIVAILLNKKTDFSVGQIVMSFNVIIFSCAALVLGWDRALYSMLAYFAAHKVMDIVIQGFDEAKAVMVVSDRAEEIADAITAGLGRGVTFMNGRGGYSKSEKTILYSVVTRLEIAKLRAIVREMDPDAFCAIHDVADVMDGKHKKRNIH